MVLAAASIASTIVACDRRAVDAPDTRVARAPPQAATSASAATITVFVAASTKDVIQELTDRFRKQTGAKATVSPGPSNALAMQIAAGAPADLFLSASPTWAEKLRADGLAADLSPLLTNALVVVVALGNPAGVKSPADFAQPRVHRVALAGERVPAGAYAEQALRAARVYDGLLQHGKVIRGHDARSTLTLVERGEAEAGVVYSTDARLTPRVEIAFTFDPVTHDRILYPLVLLKRGAANEAARRFFAYLKSAAADEVYHLYGFRRAE